MPAVRLTAGLVALVVTVAAQTSSSSGVPARYSHCGVVFANQMVVYGGRGFRSDGNSNEQLTTLGDVWAFSFDRDTWTLLSNSDDQGSPDPRSSHVCVLVQEAGLPGQRTASMLVFGGMARPRATDSASVVSDVWRLALTEDGFRISGSWQRLQPLGRVPPARFDHAGIAYNDGLLVYGGCETSAAYSDVWRLIYSGNGTQSNSDYRWQQLPHTLTAPRSPPPPPSVGGEVNRASTSPPPSPFPPPPLAYWNNPVPTPGARCAHSAVAMPSGSSVQGMLVFGGRIPLAGRSRYSSNDATWRTLSDAWIFDVAKAEQLAAGTYAGTEAHPSSWQQMPLAMSTTQGVETGSAVAVNRSDHSAILRNGKLMLFGGLYTDLVENTIYIMKDFLNVGLPQRFGGTIGHTASAFDSHGFLERLDYGPAWRFDHTMVIAPSMPHPDRQHSGRTLVNAPVLYGGGGGMEIFADMWVYDHSVGDWFSVDAASPMTEVSILTSLLFGTVGFGLYACVIVCVFIRRIARARQRLGGNAWNPRGPPGTLGGGVGNAGPGGRRGTPAELVAALPRVLWSDVVKSAATDCADDAAASSSQAPSGVEAAAKGAGTEEEEEVCPVCLCAYELDDTLLRLPCDHLFHEACVSRWLQQDSSCPHCRHQLLPPAQPPRSSARWTDDPEMGTEMVARPSGRAPPRTAPPTTAQLTAAATAQRASSPPASPGSPRNGPSAPSAAEQPRSPMLEAGAPLTAAASSAEITEA